MDGGSGARDNQHGNELHRVRRGPSEAAAKPRRRAGGTAACRRPLAAAGRPAVRPPGSTADSD